MLLMNCSLIFERLMTTLGDTALGYTREIDDLFDYWIDSLKSIKYFSMDQM